MKILIVGDLHGDWGRLNTLITNKNPDIILQCGDFGWWPKMEITRPVLYKKQNIWLLKGIKPKNTKIYWCDGNHEEHNLLVQDSLIHEMYENVYHASRGSVLKLPDNRNVLFIGGADSIDKKLRTINHDWYYEENISYDQFEMTMAIEDRIDIVISHTCPGKFDIEGTGGKINDSNRIALDYILEKYKPSLWFFGHWHKNKKGKYKDTYWECLDYAGHGGKWWEILK